MENVHDIEGDTATMSTVSTETTLEEQAPMVLSQIPGYVGHRTVSMGLRTGLAEALADAGAGTTIYETGTTARTSEGADCGWTELCRSMTRSIYLGDEWLETRDSQSAGRRSLPRSDSPAC